MSNTVTSKPLSLTDNSFDSPPSTPVKKQPDAGSSLTSYRGGIPPTPMIAKKTQSRLFTSSAPPPKKDLFPGKQETLADPIYQEHHCYSLNGVQHTIIQQLQNKDCGGAALLMLFTDAIRINPSIKLDAELIAWASSSYLTEADQMIAEASKRGLQAAKLMLSSSTAIETLAIQVKETSLPLIMSITHPIIEAHWIVVDAVQEGHIYIRDPHSGEAFKIPSTTFLTYLDGDIEQCLYFRFK